MNIKFNLLGALALAAVLGACSQKPADSSPASQAPTGDTGLATLNVDPGKVTGCDQDSWATSTVSWQVKNNAAAHVKVVVADPGSETANLFTEGGAEGNAKTEKWVQSGTRFTLLNADTGANLASYTVQGPDCSAAR